VSRRKSLLSVPSLTSRCVRKMQLLYVMSPAHGYHSLWRRYRKSRHREKRYRERRHRKNWYRDRRHRKEHAPPPHIVRALGAISAIAISPRGSSCGSIAMMAPLMPPFLQYGKMDSSILMNSLQRRLRFHRFQGSV